jgi:SAM-dependent methyltransferase
MGTHFGALKDRPSWPDASRDRPCDDGSWQDITNSPSQDGSAIYATPCSQRIPVMSSTLQRLMRKTRKRRPAAGPHAPSWFETERPQGELLGLPRDWLTEQQINGAGGEVKWLLDDPSTRAAIERDEVPIPALDDREGYFVDWHLSYWLSGLADLRVVEGCVPSSAFAQVLDFGGASGRFARHVAMQHAATVTIAELNVNHVHWVERHFGPQVRAVKVSPYPHFPLADGSMTLCVAFSVFTHINSYETGWLAEIHRTLAPGGYAVLTIHSEDTWSVLSTRPHILKTLSRDPRFDPIYNAGGPMPAERMVFDYNPNSIEHNCNVFFSSEYIRRCWGKWFEVVEIRARAHHDFQTVVVLRKRG